ncbi:MAG: hypothetical protein AAF621_03560 [Pseudomonadota bacterium]
MIPDIEPKETYALDVIDVIRHQDSETVDLFLRQPEELEFFASDAIGVPASLPFETLSELKSMLNDLEYEDYLVPYKGYPSPDYAFPSDALLRQCVTNSDLFLKNARAEGESYKVIRQNTSHLKTILENQDLTEKLKANYSVIDLVKLFPNILSAKNILEHQPKEHGNKTYTVDGRPHIFKNDTKCFRINVKYEACPTYRALFNEENPEGIKLGQSSSYLHSLEVGDKLIINTAKKPGPQIPEFSDEARAIIIVTQGNSLIRMLSVLEDIKQRKEKGEKFGKILLIPAFRTQKHILELGEIKPYLQKKTVDELHLCLSRENKAIEYDMPSIVAHCGHRIQKLFDNGPLSKIEKPFILLGGGEAFSEQPQSVAKFLADRFGYDFADVLNKKQTHKDMRISNSPDRKPSLQGVAYSFPMAA